MAKNSGLKVEAAEVPDAVNSSEEIEERIRRRAHELYEARGREEGHDVEDWLQAEAEIGTAEAIPEQP